MKNHQQLPLLVALLLALVNPHLTVGQYSVNFGAEAGSFNAFTLTPDSNWMRGAIWNTEQASLNEVFDFTFEVNLGSKDEDGADGIVFAFQAVDANQGGAGQGMGIGGVMPSLFVELDTWMNPIENDPDFDHIAIGRDGMVNHADTVGITTPVPILMDSANAEDGEWHSLRVSWDPVAQELNVYMDCNLRISYGADVVQEIFGGDPMVYYGFTSATGGFNNQHMVRVPYQDNIPDTLLDGRICAGASHQVVIPAGSNWSWEAINGDQSSISDPLADEPLLSPTQTTTYVGTFDFNCETRVDSLTVYVNDELDANITTLDTIACVGDDPLELTADPAEGYWSGLGIGDSLFGSWNPNNLAPGHYGITYTLGQGDCESTDSITMVLSANPIADPGENDTICLGESRILAAAPGGTSYTWKADPSLSVLDAAFTSATPTTGTWYFVTVSDGNCQGSDSVHIEVAQASAVEVDPFEAPCVGQELSLNATGSLNYAWFYEGDLVSSNATWTFSPVAESEVLIVGMDAQGCLDSLPLTIGVSPNPTPELDGPTQVCPADTVTLNASGGVLMNWLDPQFVVAVEQGQLQIAPQATAIYTVEVVTDQGCRDTASIEVVVANELTLTLSTVTPICLGDTAVLSADAGTNITWTFDPSLTSSVGSEVNAIPTTDTWYFATAISGNCEASDSVFVEVLPEQSATLMPDTMICQGSLPLNLLTDIDGGRWIGTGVSDSINGIFDPLLAATGKNELEYVLDGSCVLQSTVVVTVQGHPQPVIDPIGPICDTSDLVPLQASVAGGTWSGDGVEGGFFNPSLVGHPSSQTVIYTVEEQGCEGVDSIEVLVDPIAVSMPTDTAVCTSLNLGAQLLPQASNAQFYAWNDGSVGSSLYVDRAGIYQVTVSNSSGCQAQAEINVESECGCDVWLPTAFTPDNNGKNDAYKGVVSDDRFAYEMYIHDRWGEVVWSTASNADSWNGQFRNQPAKEDVYVVTGSCGTTRFNTRVTLVR